MNAAALNLPRLPLDALLALQPDFGVLPFGVASQRRMLVGTLASQPCVVVGTGAGGDAWDWLQGRVGDDCRFAWVDDADLDAVLQRHGATMRASSDLDGGGERGADGVEIADELTLAGLSTETNPVLRTLGATLFDAYRSGASDIHFECRPGGMAIKHRLDGVLTPGLSVDRAELAEQLVSRIKVLGRLDVGERRVPQDGRFRVRLEGRDVDLRVSVIPGAHGEDAVLRILDRRTLTDERSALDLARLGFGGDELETLRALAARPHGMLLVTGPTGSGKTTTLYAALSEVNDGRQKIVTIEDPVEYQLGGVLQVPVNERTGLSFARGLRAILRHDPDTILVGEIRDQETAQIAVQAALTGHLVLSSIHANTVFDVIARFLHMGVDAYELTAALNGVAAQRLIRLVCPRCAGTAPIGEALARRHPALAGLQAAPASRGCGDCRGTGYRGRVAVAEVLVVDDAMREAVLRRESPRRLREQALAAGMRPLSAHVAALVRAGRTTLEELQRVADME